MEENEVKLLAIHKILKEEFTEEQIRIMLVASLEKIVGYDYDKVVGKLDQFNVMFNN